MKRMALLVEASNVQGEKALPGAVFDLVNYRAFLKTNAGGAWTDAEIVPLSNPSRTQLLEKIDAARSANYFFFAFSGHGHHVRGSGVDETRLCLQSRTEVSVTECNPGSDRCTLLIDSCRGLTEMREEKRAVVANARQFSLSSEALKYRMAFDATVEQLPKGCVRLFSCDVNETAGEWSGRGGYFSRTLLDEADAWIAKQGGGTRGQYFPWDQAFQQTTATIKAFAPQQNPKDDSGRMRTPYFPMALWLP